MIKTELQIDTIYGDAGREEILKAASIEKAHLVVVAELSLAEKMRACIAARNLNSRISIVATADNLAERAWLREFGATSIRDAIDEITEALLRSIRRAL